MKNKYVYFVRPLGDNKSPAYEAIIPKFENLHVFSDTLRDLEEMVNETIEIEINRRKKKKIPIPEPENKTKFHGKILLRIKPELHEKLYFEASANDLSLNQYIQSRLN